MEFEHLFPNERLRRARHRKGWTQSDLAEALDTDFETVSRWERGITIPSAYYREKLCEVLGQSAEELGLIAGSSAAQPSLSTPLVFLASSHADAERGVVLELKAHLQARGIVLWSSRSVKRSSLERSTHALQEVIRAASVVLVVASPEARSSRHVRETLRIARIYRCLVCAVWIEGQDLQESLPGDCGELFATIDARKQHDPSALDGIEAALDKALRASGDGVVSSTPSNQAADPPSEPRNPYKGLRPYRSEDRQDFFGRDALIDELIAALEASLHEEKQGYRDARLLPVIGPSGSGKSSLMMAGLLPRLQAGGLPGSEQWVYLGPMVPGTHPLASLALILAEHFPGKSPSAIREDLDYDSARALHVLTTTLVRRRGDATRAVLFVDQFEELFTQTIDEEERQGFIDVLVAAITEPDGPLIVILTLRADFYDRPLQYPELATLMQKRAKSVLPMELQDLQAVIERPAALRDVRLTFEGNLAGDLLFDVQGQPGALPLLQFTLDQLFQRHRGSLLTLSAYQEIGGVKGALAKHAEATYAELPSDQHRVMARSLFLRLINPGFTEQDTTRRRTPLDELTLAAPEKNELLQQVTAHFLAARLLTASVIAGRTTVEVSHEALIREWQRLADWLWEAHEDVRLQQAISEDVAKWEQRGKPKDRLYRGSQLKEAQEWVKRNTPSKQEAAFLRASAARRVRVIVSVIAIFLILLSTAGLAVWLRITFPNPTIVTTLNDSGPGSIRQAIASAKPGDTITFDPGLRGTIMLKSEDLKITKSLDIRGPSAGVLSISGGDRDPGLGVVVLYHASVTISGLAFKDTKRNGECLITNYGTLTFTNSMISGNTTFPGGVITPAGDISCRGGGIGNSGTLTLNNSVVSGNTGPSGGIFNDGTLKLIGSSVSNNTASGSGNSGNYDGGGIFNGGTLTLINSTVSGNTTSRGNGAGIWNGLDTKGFSGLGEGGGTLTLTNSTVSGNSANGDGGGIYNDGAITITKSTISGNMASDNGGGMYNERSSIVNGGPVGGMLTLMNSTVSDNTATTDGGGIAFVGTQASITFCTIFGNKAAHKGDSISIQDSNFGNNLTHSQVEVRDTILAANNTPVGHDIWGTLISDGYNLFQDNSGATFDPSTAALHRTDKLLSGNDLSGLFASPVGLGNNGGPTLTYALAPGSPAIDAVPLQDCQFKIIFDNQSRKYTDQRGYARPDGNERACDIGAYEYVD